MKPIGLVFVAVSLSTFAVQADEPTQRPNIVVIYADDLGYGDVQCYNPERCKIPTPHVDAMAKAGMRFTDAHSSSAVCSPSRYALLTGRYHWRDIKGGGTVKAYGSPWIKPKRLTLPALLKQEGYRTAAIGKWHLGIVWPRKGEKIDFSQPMKGPTSRGFDFYFGVDVPNYPPYCFIENDRTVGIPTAQLPAALLERGHHLADKQGPAMPGWKLEDVLPTLVEKTTTYIREAAGQPKPFFLYLALTTPHTPLAPNKAWQGKSGLGRYGDLVMETDDAIGRVLAALEQCGLAENTLVVLTSDNGFAPYIGVRALEKKGHYPSGPLAGYKGDVWEGGHRVPFIVRWPGKVPANTVSNQLVHQVDLMATCAEVAGATLPKNSAIDSVNLLPVFKNQDQRVRKHAVSQSTAGLLSVRQVEWKLIFGRGSGSWSIWSKYARRPLVKTRGQLYNLKKDPGETQNLYAKLPDRVTEMTTLMDAIREGQATHHD